MRFFAACAMAHASLFAFAVYWCIFCVFCAPYCPDLVAGKMAVLRIIRIILYFVLYLYYVLSYPGLIPVSTTVRLKDIKFSRSQGGPQERELRGRSNLEFLSEDMHNAILAACTGE